MIAKYLFKTFNKTNAGVDYHNNWHSLVITAMLMIRQELSLNIRMNII
jgi:hypothetical protein